MLSYNSICVALDNGTWSCELVPLYDYRSPSGQSLAFMQGDELKQLQEDRRTFDRYFRPRYDFHQTFAPDINAIRCFMLDHLRGVSQDDLPKDNADIERMLKRAVRDERIVPVVDYDRRIPVNTANRPYAPQYWGLAHRGGIGGGGGGGMTASTSGKSFHQMAMDSMGLTAEGAWAYIERYDAMVGRANAVLDARAALRSEGGLVGAAVAGAAPGDADGVMNGSVEVPGEESFADHDDSTPLGNARPFDYQPTASGNPVQFAARGVSEAQESECFAEYESALRECQLYSAMTKDPYTFVACKAQAFSNYNRCRGY